MKKFIKIIIVAFFIVNLNAQNSNVKNVPFTNIGPAVMSGRVVDEM